MICQSHKRAIATRRGRSIPGRQTLLDLAQSLEVPLRERNLLLLSAGYAPMYSAAG